MSKGQVLFHPYVYEKAKIIMKEMLELLISKGADIYVEDIIYHSETGEKMIAYRQLYGENKLWCRPYDMFFDEVNKNGQKYRFELQQIESKRGEE